jgi:hypothetical protein
MLGGQSEQNRPSHGLIQLEMKKSNKPSPPLAKGQLWKTDKGYIQIWHIGKRLIEYKMMKRSDQRAVRTQATGIDALKEHLKNQKAVLVIDSPALTWHVEGPEF